MKAFLISLVFMGFVSTSSAQDENKIDSLLKVLSETKNDTVKIWTMCVVAYNYMYSNSDSSAWYAQQALALSKKINYELGIIKGLNGIGNALIVTGSYSSALQIFLETLERAEKIKDEMRIGVALGNIGEVYISEGDYKQAISYGKRSLAINLSEKDTSHLLISYLNLADYYQKARLLDSSLFYINQAYQLSIKTNEIEQSGAILNIMGDIHSGLGNDEIAFPYYRKAVLANHLIGDDLTISKSYYSMAQLFKRKGNMDSVFFYIRMSYQTALNISDKIDMLKATTLLAEIYQTTNSDSTVKYLKLSIALKDSLFALEKTKQVQSLTINEQIRQSKMEEEKEMAAEERRKNLQMAAIGAFIPLFFGIVLLFNKRKVKQKTVEFMGLLGLLLLFEFISLFMHPYIGEWTHHTPVFMLLILVVLAALLVPMHHKMEHWVKVKLAQKSRAASTKLPLADPDADNNNNV